MRVQRLRIYPVKSLAGSDVARADVNPWGLGDDRRWGLVDAAGTKLTAREHNQFLAVRAEAGPGRGLRLTDRDGGVLDVAVPGPGAERVAVTHARQGEAAVASAEADRWLSARFDLPVRLVWQESLRTMSADAGGQGGDVVSLADAAPLLLTSEASMSAVNEWAGQELDPVRFRPNVLIDGDEPFAEEGWGTVTIGDVRFRMTAICDRCVMTTIDPDTLTRGKEPIRSLAMHRRRAGKTWFGIRMTPLTTGTIRVGDPVTA